MNMAIIFAVVSSLHSVFCGSIDLPGTAIQGKIIHIPIGHLEEKGEDDSRVILGRVYGLKK